MSVPKPLVRTGLRFVRPLMHSSRVSLATKRSVADAIAGTAVPPEGTIYDFDVIAGTPVQSVTVENAGPTSDRSTVVFLHGGGHVVGSSRAYRGFAANLAKYAGMDVIVPEYPLAPESPYPAALDAMVALYRALPAYGVDPSSVILAGDDAGAGLALAMAMEIRDRGLPMPSAIGMINPWLDLSRDLAGDRPSVGNSAWFTPALASRWARPYVVTADPATPSISPLRGDLAELPPMVVHYSGKDPLRVDAEELVMKAAGMVDGPRVIAREHAQMGQSFHLQVGQSPEADAAVEEFGSAVASLAAAPRRHRVGAVPINRPVAGRGGRRLTLVPTGADVGTPSARA